MYGRYQDLEVYQLSNALALDVYRCTRRFPHDERHGLIDQMRRAAVSIPSFIAEGAARETRGEFRNLLSSVNGSAAELECQIGLAQELGFLDDDDHNRLSARIVSIRKMLRNLAKPMRPPSP